MVWSADGDARRDRMDADAAICLAVTHYAPLMAKRPIDVALGLSGSLELYGAPRSCEE